MSRSALRKWLFIAFVPVVLVAGGVTFGVTRALARAADTPEQRWGIRVEGLRQTAGGTALDFRFRVLDPIKAQPVLAAKDDPVAVHLKTGTQLAVPHPPRFGALRSRSTHVKPGQLHFVLFSNPNQLVAVGDEVSVSLWGTELAKATVE